MTGNVWPSRAIIDERIAPAFRQKQPATGLHDTIDHVRTLLMDAQNTR